MLLCPSACPSYRGLSLERGKPVGQCDECGEYLYEDDSYYQNGKFVLCDSCAEDFI